MPAGDGGRLHLVAEQTLEYRLSKGLALSHGASRDLRANPRPEGPQACATCDREIGSRESTMWIAPPRSAGPVVHHHAPACWDTCWAWGLMKMVAIAYSGVNTP